MLLGRKVCRGSQPSKQIGEVGRSVGMGAGESHAWPAMHACMHAAHPAADLEMETRHRALLRSRFGKVNLTVLSIRTALQLERCARHAGWEGRGGGASFFSLPPTRYRCFGGSLGGGFLGVLFDAPACGRCT